MVFRCARPCKLELECVMAIVMSRHRCLRRGCSACMRSGLAEDDVRAFPATTEVNERSSHTLTAPAQHY